MLSSLRIAVVIGVIYYLSPVRNEDTKAGIEHVMAWGKGLVLPPREPSREARSAGDLEALWRSLPEDARRAAVGHALAEVGKRLPLPGEAKKPKP